MAEVFNVKLFDELEPCYPDMDVSKGEISYGVAGTNGTYAGVNMIFSGLTPGVPVSISIKGPHTGFKLFKMIPVPVEVNTGAKLRSEYLKNDFNTHVIRRAPFMVYDALEPIYNIFMPKYTTAGLNFKSIIEYVKEKGIQKFDFVVTHGEQSKVLSLIIEVYPQQVPKANQETHQYVNWLSFKAIEQAHGVNRGTQAYDSILEKYLRAAVYSRQNMLALPINEYLEEKDGQIILDKIGLKHLVDIAKKSGITWFHGMGLACRALNLMDDDEFYNSLDHEHIVHTDEVAEAFKSKAFELFDYGKEAKIISTSTLFPSKKGEEELKDISKQIYEFVVDNDLEDIYYQCVMDEPDDYMAEAYGQLTDIVKQEMNGIKILEPVMPTKEVKGFLDVWCPCLDQYEKNKKFFDAQVEQGDELFVYSCLTPGGDYCNRFLDFERLRMVWIGWAPAKYENIKGYLHWGGNQFKDINPFKRQCHLFGEQVLEFHPKRANFLPSGDYCIFYPGEYEPLISIRSEAHRIGFEDLYLLKKLKGQSSQIADELIDKVFRGYCDYEKSVKRYREVKKQLLEEI